MSAPPRSRRGSGPGADRTAPGDAARGAASRRAPRAEAGPVDPGPAPNQTRLRDAALAHLARFAATEISLVRVLDRRIARWCRQAQTAGRASDEVAAAAAIARQAARAVAQALVGAKVVDDAAFAEARTRSLTRGGRSRRAIGAHLAGRGVAPELIEAAIEQSGGADLHAAVLQARRRRIGPFGPPEALDDPATAAKALGALARAGFDRDTAERALRMDPEEAERIVLARHAV